MSIRDVNKAFKMRGLSIQRDAAVAVTKEISSSPNPTNTLSQIIDTTKAKIDSSFNKSLLVTMAMIESAVAEQATTTDDITNESLQLLDAFNTPRISYEPMRKTFRLFTQSEESRTLHADANSKVAMFRERFNLVHQRVKRHSVFRTSLSMATSSGTDESVIKLTNIDSLLGEYGTRFLLGMITQVEENKYYLEDLTGRIPLNLGNITCDGFVTENCIVLVEGEVVDGVFTCVRMGMPPYEMRSNAIDALGLQTADIFSSIGNRTQLKLLQEQEEDAIDSMFVILSDVHLDKPLVIEKLKDLFEGYQHHSTLPVFIFMGNFTSLPISHAKDGVKTAIDNFDALGNMIAEDFPRIARKAKFIFIPGNHDPGGGEVYPRPPLPRIFTRVLESKIQHFNAASNPCRLRFFSQEIVFFREDLVNKLQRNCIVPPEEVEGGDGGGGGGSSEIPKNAVKTLLDQGHLCPLPIGTNPVYWEYDHALRLYPPPDALVVGDSVAQHVLSYDGCTAMNPGSFVQDWNFVVYRPTDGETEFSSLA